MPNVPIVASIVLHSWVFACQSSSHQCRVWIHLSVQLSSSLLEIKLVSEQAQPAAIEHASLPSVDKDNSPASSFTEYAGAPAPVCEINRRQHLLDLNIMHTVGAAC